MSVNFRLARPGDGDAVARLAKLALHDYEAGSVPEELGKKIDECGGRFSVERGRAHTLVTVEEERVIGMIYLTPPVTFLSETTDEFGAEEQRMLARAMVELQLLAIEEDMQGRGVGRDLLAFTEKVFRIKGAEAFVAKIHGGDYNVEWYRRQGFDVTPPGDPSLGDAWDDRFHYGIKMLDGTTVEREPEYAPAEERGAAKYRWYH